MLQLRPSLLLRRQSKPSIRTTAGFCPNFILTHPPPPPATREDGDGDGGGAAGEDCSATCCLLLNCASWIRGFEAGTLDRTKVVLRHLPPAITEPVLVEQVDSAFADRYNWLSFCPGKISQKHQSYSRAYIDFKRPEDVFEFAEFFNGHVFVNEKGAQFKIIVEYAPSQHVPKQCSKKDGREGTIFKDPEYLEFLEFLAKPVENLPSAEIQLERRETERAGVPKDTPIVTPLMDFVRQKRAAKVGSRVISFNPNNSIVDRRILCSVLFAVILFLGFVGYKKWFERVNTMLKSINDTITYQN